MPCASGKDTYPDLQTALVARDQLIQRYAVPILAYKCLSGCYRWHLTTHWKSGRMVRVWNNIETDWKLHRYWERVIDAGYRERGIDTITAMEKYL